MQPFLASVAKAYSTYYRDLSEMCFIFPNKRSSAFFLKYLRDNADNKVIVSPETMTISDFMEKMSERIVDSDLDRLLRLFNVYKELLSNDQEYLKRFGEPDFDSFRTWGETVLADFDEVDTYCVDYKEIFKNVKDFREISTDFLTDEQKEVLEEYFGVVMGDKGPGSSFWNNFNSDKDMSEIKKKFIYLWEILAPLYERLNESLEKDGLVSAGGVYRLAKERIEKMESADMPWKKIVFVGFNALSISEARIFKSLKKMKSQINGEESYADFIWDATGPVLTDKSNSSSEFIASDKKNFPSPSWTEKYLKESDTEDLPEELLVISSPSKTSQAKIAGDIIAKLRNEKHGSENMNNARIAVVLPDESLLLPLLYSLPESIRSVNLTMGYPLRLTSTVSFINHLRKLHTHRRNINGESFYYSPDLTLFLGHPFTHIAIGSGNAAKLNSFITRTHRSMVSLTEIKEISEETFRLLEPIDKYLPPEQVIDRIDRVLKSVDDRMGFADELIVKSKLDKTQIAFYRDALRVLRQSVVRHKVTMGFSSVFKLVDKLISPLKVPLKGEPLQGLQIMGLLETRALDFEHLVIPSLNEGKLPMKMRKRSFIPNSLRADFGMPRSNYQESIFSYYFYRLISRAKSVTMIYDARTGAGAGSNEPSRYLQQLSYLYAGEKLKKENRRFLLGKRQVTETAIVKTESVMNKLNKFLDSDSGKYLSHSSLRTYRDCQVRFYYEKVVGLSDEVTPGYYLDPITQGTIVHNMMLNLYLPEDMRERELEIPLLITKEKITDILSDDQLLRKMIVREINREHFNYKGDKIDTPLPNSLELVAPYILKKVEDVLNYDRSIAPFRIIGCEVKEFSRWPISDGREVNFTFVIDRMDIVEESGKEIRRIVDYKTGKVKVSNKEEMLFYTADIEAGNLEHALQLMEYATLLNHGRGENTDYRLCIYGTDEMDKGAQNPVSGNRQILGINDVKEEFEKEFTGLLTEVFDKNIPFVQASDPAKCRYCPLKDLCGRTI